MKKLLGLLMLTLFSMTAFSAVEVAKIVERNSGRQIVYSMDEDNLTLTLYSSSTHKVLKRLAYTTNNSYLTLQGDRDLYSMEILKNSIKVEDMYNWCWGKTMNVDDPGAMVQRPAFAGAYALTFGAVASIAFCGIGPALAPLAGLILAPIDALITVGDRVFDVDAIAARKFNKMLKGKKRKVSKKVFKSLIKQISIL